MCDFARKLTAWMDGELAATDAIVMERHLHTCHECRDALQKYRQVSKDLAAYLDACGSEAMKPDRSLRRVGVVAISTAAVIAALFLMWGNYTVQRSSRIMPPIRSAAAVPQLHASPRTADAASGASKTVHPPRQTRRAETENDERQMVQRRRQSDTGFAAGSAVEIAIPADAIFPPGAIPADVAFTADVTIAPDGSVEQVQLRPQFAVLERRSTRP